MPYTPYTPYTLYKTLTGIKKDTRVYKTHYNFQFSISKAVGINFSFLASDQIALFLCHFWWQKWRKSHAPHLWQECGFY